MNKKLVTLISSTALLASPILASAVVIPAQPGGGLGSVQNVLNAVLTPLWQILFAAAIIAMIISAFFFLTSGGEPGKVATARQALIWAVVGFIVGIIAFSLPFAIKTLIPG